MQLLLQVLFIALTAASVLLFYRRIKVISQLISMGATPLPNDQPGKRWANVLLLALGQKKMFSKPLVAVMHLIIYAGFIIINLEVAEIVLDGITGHHRLFLPLLGDLYTWLIRIFELLAAGVLLVCIVFLLRRNVI
ncbi:MAG: Fe-S oxidoreductase, partial [Chitinophagaceae bacterium]|nr:Fe-S oxidoreductase [Chitinophagaceae bacterium]